MKYRLTSPEGESFEITAPEGATEQEVIDYFKSNLPQREEKGMVESAGDAITEFASAVNRGAVNLLDYIGPDQINNALQVIGSEKRVPTIGEQKIIQEATTGNFMEPGLAKDVVRTAGEYVAPAVVTGGVIRGAAQAVPQSKILQSMVSTPPQEAIGAALAGAGAELGEEVGEEVAGEKGRQIGRLMGGVLAPVSASVAKETGKVLLTKSAKKLLAETAPTIDGLKSAARKVYTEIDNLGVTVNPRSVTRLSEELAVTARKQGFNPRVHPKVNAALREFKNIEGQAVPLSDIDTLRRVANASAISLDPDEARLGGILVNKIDDFLDNLKSQQLSKSGMDIGIKYRDARQLWRRAKKAEILQDAFEKANMQATGFENGIRVQFRSILNSKRKSKGFTKEELDAMRKVVKGTTSQNIAKMIGKFGFSEGQASNMLLGSLGVAGGAAVGGPAGAVAVPLIGQISRNLAQKLTRNNAQGTDLIIRAGKNGKEVVKAYMKITTPKERNAQELTELLLRPDISLEGLKSASVPQAQRKLISDAVFMVNAIKSEEE